MTQGMWIARARAILFSERGVIGSQHRGSFLIASVVCWNEFSHKKSTIQSLYTTSISKILPTQSPPLAQLLSQLQVKKQNKMIIRVGSVVKEGVGGLEDIIMEGRSRNMRKDVVGCVHAVVGKKKEITSCLIFF